MELQLKMADSSIGPNSVSPQPNERSAPKSPENGFALVVGEVLWDCFEDRTSLGGAPLNVAWSLAGLGINPLFVSAVGDDDLGREVLERMTAFGMCTDGVAVLPGVPTGTVQVRMNNGEPEYDIVRNVAWDQIPSPMQTMVGETTLQSIIDARIESAKAAGQPVLMYHGSLACRDDRSRSTIEFLRNGIEGSVFFDVNLRTPHYEQEVLDSLRRRASIIKLNLDELNELTRDLGGSASSLEATLSPEANTTIAGDHFQQTNAKPFETLMVTLGAEGAIAYQPTGPTLNRVASPVPETMVDPVGAGDAFAAVVIHGLLTGRSLDVVLPDAVAFASRVCGLPGATCGDHSFYRL